MTTRPRLNAVAGPLLGEFLLAMTVGMAGLWMASHTSDAAAGAFGLGVQVVETLFVIFRVLAIGGERPVAGGQASQVRARSRSRPPCPAA